MTESSPGAWNREHTGVVLLLVGVALLVGFAILVLNAFHSAEAVSLALAIIFVIFGYDLIQKGMGRLGLSTPAPPSQPAYYYYPYSYGSPQQPYAQQPAYPQAPAQREDRPNSRTASTAAPRPAQARNW